MMMWKALINGGHKRPHLNVRMRMMVFVILIFGLTLVPVVNNVFVHKDAAPLYGLDNSKKLPEFSFADFWEGSFQKNFEDAFSHGFSGYRLFMRTLNEMRYRLFQLDGDKTVCKDGSLIFTNYLEEYLGLSSDYKCSDEYLDGLVEELTRLNALAESRDKQIFVLVTPSKAGFIEEQIPSKFLKMERLYNEGDRAVHRLTVRMEKAGIPFLDSAPLLHGDHPFDIFPQGGIHWTREAALHIVNAMCKELEQRGSISMKHIAVTGRRTQSVPWQRSLNQDNDLDLLMNKFSSVKTEYSYPLEEVDIPDDYILPAVFVAGDSFSYSICELFADHDMVKDVNLLFYAQSLYDYNQSVTTIGSLYDPAIEQKVRESDIIILEVNEVNINGMGSGFYPVLEEILSTDTEPQKESFQVQYRGFSPWETLNGVTWRWAYGKSALLVYENVLPTDTLEATIWVPYDVYANREGFSGAFTLDAYVNGKKYQQFQCTENSIWQLSIPLENMEVSQDVTVEIRSPYSFVASVPTGEREICLQVLNAGRNG